MKRIVRALGQASHTWNAWRRLGRRDPAPLVRALEGRGIRLVRAETPSPREAHLFALAEWMAMRFDAIEGLLRCLRSSIGRRLPAVAPAENMPDEAWEMMRRCKNLGIVRAFGYRACTRQLWFLPPEAPAARELVCGGWLERYAWLALRRAFPASPILRKAVVEVRTCGGVRHVELDVCALLPSGALFAVEAKSGKVRGHEIARARRAARSVCTREGDIMVVLRCVKPPRQLRRVAARYRDQMRIVSIRRFDAWLREHAREGVSHPDVGGARAAPLALPVNIGPCTESAW